MPLLDAGWSSGEREPGPALRDGAVPKGPAGKVEPWQLATELSWRFDAGAGARLHLQSGTSSHRVWLERDGHRAFEPEGALDASVFAPLEVVVSRPEIREAIERAWISRMIGEGWLELEWVSERSIVLCAYSGRVGAFRRHVELRSSARTATSSGALRPLCPQHVRLSRAGVLQLWEHELPLSQLLWSHRGHLQRAQVRCEAGCCSGAWSEPAECWVGTCSGGSCEVHACSASAITTGDLGWQPGARASFERAVENVLWRGLFVHYRAALRAKHGALLSAAEPGEQHPDRRVTRLLETELVPLVASVQDAQGGRRAYAEVVFAFGRDRGARLRSRVEELVLLDLDLRKLSHALEPEDRLSFWRTVDGVLASAWAAHGASAKGAGRVEGSPELASVTVQRCFPDAKTAVRFRDVAGHDWGWLCAEDDRMYLQSLERGALTGPKQVRVWLEDRGVRTFVVARGELSQSELDELRAVVNAERLSLESRWLCFMVQQRRLEVNLSGSLITFTAYPKSPQQFIRRLELRRLYPGAYTGQHNWDDHPPELDWDFSNGLLAVGHQEDINDRNHIHLDELFED